MPRKLLLALLVLLFFLGIRIYCFYLFAPQLSSNSTVTFTAIVLSQPSEFSNYDLFSANYGNFFSNKIVNIIYSKNIPLEYGQVVRISGRIRDRVIKPIKVIKTIYFPKIEAVSKNTNFVLAVTNYIRQNAEKVYQKYLSPKETDLLLGIVLGEKANFSKDFLHSLQVTGVMHVIAASGMNISMVAGFLFWFFAAFLSRRGAVMLALSGLASSIILATIMGAAALVAQLWGRQYSGLWGIVISVYCMLMVNPGYINDIGFQLSVAATLGIFGIKPLFPHGILLEDIETTISAQLAALPILLSNFGNYGLFSILANALVLWTIPILMIVGCLALFVGLLIPPLGSLLILTAKPFVWFFIFTIEQMGKISPSLNVGSLPTILVILLLFATVLLLGKLQKSVDQHTGM